MRSLWFIFLLVASSVRAEVRVDQRAEGPVLTVRPVARGIWTPSPGAERHTLLNATGDLRGDGFPAHARKPGELLVAWQRPATSDVVIVETNASGRDTTISVATREAIGVPQPIAIEGGWIVLWQSGGVRPVVEGVTIAEGAVRSSGPLQDGLLLAAEPVEEGLVVVTMDPARSELLITAYFTAVANPVPIPIEWLRVGVPSRSARSAVDDEVQVPQVCTASTDGGALIAWVAERGVIGVLRERGGRLSAPTEVRGPNGSCQAILRAASR